jgi:hypothetical protein
MRDVESQSESSSTGGWGGGVVKIREEAGWRMIVEARKLERRAGEDGGRIEVGSRCLMGWRRKSIAEKVCKTSSCCIRD